MLVGQKPLITGTKDLMNKELGSDFPAARNNKALFLLLKWHFHNLSNKSDAFLSTVWQHSSFQWNNKTEQSFHCGCSSEATERPPRCELMMTAWCNQDKQFNMRARAYKERCYWSTTDFFLSASFTLQRYLTENLSKNSPMLYIATFVYNVCKVSKQLSFFSCCLWMALPDIGSNTIQIQIIMLLC